MDVWDSLCKGARVCVCVCVCVCVTYHLKARFVVIWLVIEEGLDGYGH